MSARYNITNGADPVTPHVEPHTRASVSEREAATLAKWTREDLAAGKITSEQADKIFTELNSRWSSAAQIIF